MAKLLLMVVPPKWILSLGGFSNLNLVNRFIVHAIILIISGQIHIENRPSSRCFSKIRFKISDGTFERNGLHLIACQNKANLSKILRTQDESFCTVVVFCIGLLLKSVKPSGSGDLNG